MTIPPIEPEFEMVRAALDRGTSVAALKEIAKMFNLCGDAQKKEVLFNRIRDSPHVIKISATEFEYRRPKTGAASAGGNKIPTWILLTHPRKYLRWMALTWEPARRVVSSVPRTRRMLLVGRAQIS